MIRSLCILVALLFAAGTSSSAFAQPENPFRSLTTWGKWLYAYDAACWVATDTVIACHPDSSKLRVFVALQVGSQWLVAFGRLDTGRFAISYEVTLDSTNHVLASVSHTPALVAPKVLYRAAQAFQTGTNAFGRRSRPFNPMVLPQADGTWSVYLVPGETSTDSVYLGSDVRFTVSADGLSIIDTTRLHASLIVSPKPPVDAEVPALIHSHALIPMPVETDVYYVLRQKPRVRHYITAGERLYAIEPDGEIRLVMVR
jgi:hypothetical protein